ncbi:FAD binding domain-containing protein [Bradyrhizobium sp. BR 1432]|uniref:FAD binding domain-containing protein n=1 Tax=Bradyrhizobium sp. BR 1432 TaxID=3447966 RepID=UPI003EE7FB73
MKPASFSYERPANVASALEVLGSASGMVKVMAGGQSLGPMLNLRLAAPDLIMDIAGLSELEHAATDKGELVIGACVTHADIEDGRIPDVTRGAMSRVAAAIAYRAVRNRGTIGGSLAHADPSADWISALLALGAKAVLRSSKGSRKIAMSDFVVGALETTLQPGELIEQIRVPATSPSSRWAYVKACRKTGEFAHAIGSVLIEPEAGTARIVIGATETAPMLVKDAAELFGGRITGEFKAQFDVRVADRLLLQAGMSDPCDRQVHLTVLRRAVMEAAA